MGYCEARLKSVSLVTEVRYCRRKVKIFAFSKLHRISSKKASNRAKRAPSDVRYESDRTGKCRPSHPSEQPVRIFDLHVRPLYWEEDWPDEDTGFHSVQLTRFEILLHECGPKSVGERQG